MKKYIVDVQHEERRAIKAHNYHIKDNRIIFIRNGEKIADYSSSITNIRRIENGKD